MHAIRMACQFHPAHDRRLRLEHAVARETVCVCVIVLPYRNVTPFSPRLRPSRAKQTSQPEKARAGWSIDGYHAVDAGRRV